MMFLLRKNFSLFCLVSLLVIKIPTAAIFEVLADENIKFACLVLISGFTNVVFEVANIVWMKKAKIRIKFREHAGLVLSFGLLAATAIDFYLALQKIWWRSPFSVMSLSLAAYSLCCSFWEWLDRRTLDRRTVLNRYRFHIRCFYEGGEPLKEEDGKDIILFKCPSCANPKYANHRWSRHMSPGEEVFLGMSHFIPALWMPEGPDLEMGCSSNIKTD